MKKFEKNNLTQRCKGAKIFIGFDFVILLLAAFILLAINLGCNFSCGKFAEIKTEQAGGEAELVREAHSIVEKANQTVSKANILQNELLSKESLKEVEDFEKYNSDNKVKFDELIKMREGDNPDGQIKKQKHYENQTKHKNRLDKISYRIFADFGVV